MDKNFIEQIANVIAAKQTDMVEKDILLQMLLHDLSKNEFFSSNFAFKGGTCLIKSYIGYYRFSEDIDFTWIKQSEFEGRTQKVDQEEAFCRNCRGLRHVH